MSRAKARLSRRKLVPRSTPPMFNFIFSSIQAYTQIGLFLGALVCVGLGGLILGNSLYWRVHALRASGVIIGVTTKMACMRRFTATPCRTDKPTKRNRIRVPARLAARKPGDGAISPTIR
jgi:hypothetical protein